MKPCAYHTPIWFFPGSAMWGRILSFRTVHTGLTRTVRIPFIGELGAIGQYDTYVVSDKQYEQLKQNLEEMSIYGINITAPEQSLPWWKKLPRVMRNPGII